MKLNVEHWKEFRLDEIFNIERGSSLYITDCEEGETPYASASADNNGISQHLNVEPNRTGNCLVINYDGSVGESFYHAEPFFASEKIVTVTLKEKKMNAYIALFLSTVIKQEKFRFSYGRKWSVNSVMKSSIIKLPVTDKKQPDWNFMEQYIKSLNYKPLTTANQGEDKSHTLGIESWKPFKVNELFEVKYGINMELNTCIEAEDGDPDAINFVARTESNNGVSARVKPVEGKEPQPAGLTTCAGGGSVLSTFLQEEPFYSGRDLYLLIPLQPMSKLAKLFCITVLKANKYRYSYGRQANITLPYLELLLPATVEGQPDFDFMENYMRSLPYGDRI